jgi:hypothetical protein
MRGVRHNRIHWRWLGLAALVLAVLGPASLRPALADAQVYMLDVRGDEALVLLLPDGELARREAGVLRRLGVQALSARYLPGGDAAVVDFAFALWRLDNAGLHPWLPPGSVNAPLFVSPDGRSLAYLKPLELVPGEPRTLSNAVAVRDLATDAERVLLEAEGLTPHLYGWAGDDLVIHIPAWTPAKDGLPAQPAKELVLARLSTAGPNTPRPVAALPSLTPGSLIPQTSFDQRYLAYTAASGVILADLTTGAFARYAGLEAPLWTEAGLTAMPVGEGSGAAERGPLAWSSADLAPAPAPDGPVDLSLTQITPSDFQAAAPAAANAILLYRPVPATTGVSAYYDLDRAVGAIRDWLGWVGSSWIYGRAYDQHSGGD